jgi:hypothetical protein
VVKALRNSASAASATMAHGPQASLFDAAPAHAAAAAGADAFGSLEVFGAVPSSLIENENGVCAGGDFRCDFVEMELHGLGVASGHHEGSAGSALGAYRAEQNRDLISEADGE